MSGEAIYIYPRLPRTAAHKVIAELTGASPQDLAAYGTLSHPSAAPAAVGGSPIPKHELGRIQEGIREIMYQYGFPAQLGLVDRQNLDRSLGTYLYKNMNIVPGDAAEEGVWSFLSLIVVPELGPWRFPDRAESRLVGKPRNVLRRLWWRAWALGPDLTSAPSGCSPLSEDEYVQIMERSRLSGNRRAARAVQAAVWRADADGILTMPRTDLMRGLVQRVLATRSHIVLDVLTDDEIVELTDRFVAQVLAAGNIKIV